MTRSAEWIDPSPKYVRAGETNTIGCDATAWLTGSLTISSVATSDADGLTIASVARNSATFPNDRKGTCAINKGFTFSCSGQASGGSYEPTFALTLSDGQVKVAKVPLIGIA